MSFKAVGQGLQFIILPFIVAFFTILFWWTKTILNYLSIPNNKVGPKENLWIGLQIFCLYTFVLAPLLILTAFSIWNSFERPNPLENTALHCFFFLTCSGLVFIIVGIICLLYYDSKVKKLRSIAANQTAFDKADSE